MTRARLDKRLAALGDVFQLAFVPSDFDAALTHWTRVIGAGPFFLMEHIKTEKLQYRGQPSDVDFTAAIGYWNDVQIEIITQHNAAPSIFSEWRRAGHEGLHHVCMVVADIERARALSLEAGCTIAQEMEAGGGQSKIIYVDTGGGPGTMIEMVQTNEERRRSFFGPMREAARDWDGTNPIRCL